MWLTPTREKVDDFIIRKLSFVCHKNRIMSKVEKRALGTILTMKLHSVGNMNEKNWKRKIFV